MHPLPLVPRTGVDANGSREWNRHLWQWQKISTALILRAFFFLHKWFPPPWAVHSSYFSLTATAILCRVCRICAVSVPFQVRHERAPYLAMIAIRAKWWTGRCKLWELCNLGRSLTVNSENGHKRFEERPIQKSSDNCHQFNELGKFHFGQAIISCLVGNMFSPNPGTLFI